jgi:hypothetical protein
LENGRVADRTALAVDEAQPQRGTEGRDRAVVRCVDAGSLDTVDDAEYRKVTSLNDRMKVATNFRQYSGRCADRSFLQ